MPIKYVNRSEQTYYLHTKKTKTGKQRYFFSMKSEGTLVKEIPEDFEIYENPDAQVFLRKVQPKIITDAEKTIVEEGIRIYPRLRHSILDVKKNTLIIFTPIQDIDKFSMSFELFPVRLSKAEIETEFKKYVRYSPVMQFVLEDKDKRLFITKRFCFLGFIDDWIKIGKTDTLENLVKKYIQHIGKDSYYELI